MTRPIGVIAKTSERIWYTRSVAAGLLWAGIHHVMAHAIKPDTGGQIDRVGGGEDSRAQPKRIKQVEPKRI